VKGRKEIKPKAKSSFAQSHLIYVIPVETGIQFFELIEVSAWTIYESRLMHLQEAVREAVFIYCERTATQQMG